jgi:hypothetical protein
VKMMTWVRLCLVVIISTLAPQSYS